MKNDERKVLLITLSACGVLLGIGYITAAYGISFEGENIFSILLGIYLYFGYLMVSIFYTGPKNPMRYFQRNPSSGKEQRNQANEMYEH